MQLSKGPLERSRLLLECGAHLAVILAIPFFFLQQHYQERSRLREQAEQHRIKRADSAMGFIQMANDSERTQLRSILSEPWRKVNVRALVLANPTPQKLLAAKMAITRSVADAEIEKLADFYKAVLLCRSQEYCDRRLIDDFFRQEVTGFYCAYEHRLAEIGDRLNRDDFEADLKAYAGGCR